MPKGLLGPASCLFPAKPIALLLQLSCHRSGRIFVRSARRLPRSSNLKTIWMHSDQGCTLPLLHSAWTKVLLVIYTFKISIHSIVTSLYDSTKIIMLRGPESDLLTLRGYARSSLLEPPCLLPRHTIALFLGLGSF